MKMKNNMEQTYINQAISIAEKKHPQHEIYYEIKKYDDTDAIILKCINNNLISYTYGYVVYKDKLCSLNKYSSLKYKN